VKTALHLLKENLYKNENMVKMKRRWREEDKEKEEEVKSIYETESVYAAVGGEKETRFDYYFIFL